MKIKEAKKKLCPFSTLTNPLGILIELPGRAGVWFKTRCVPEDCMAWIETGKDEGVCGMIPERKSRPAETSGQGSDENA